MSDFHPGEIVSGEGHVVCGRCRNCLAGRRHLCAHTQGIGVNRPGAFAEYMSLPMTNVWHHAADDRSAMSPRSSIRSATPCTRPCRSTSSAKTCSITGAGPIGIMAAAVARHAGARYVVVTDVNPYRLELARKLGATLAIDPRETSLDQAQEQLGMREGFDVGLEMSGSPAAFRDMIDNMAHGGKIAMLGIPDKEMAIDWNTSSSTCSPSKASTAARCTRPGTR